MLTEPTVSYRWRFSYLTVIAKERQFISDMTSARK
jgi:hypothetical protein